MPLVAAEKSTLMSHASPILAMVVSGVTAIASLGYSRQATAQVPAELYHSDAYNVWSDRVEQGQYTARAVSRTEIVSSYSGDGRPPSDLRWNLTTNLDAYPRFESSFVLLDALYNLSLSELVADQRPDKAFNAGAKWEGVWTRDVSYSTILSLASVSPQGAKASLMQKVKRDRIVQDTGTGGSWPVSTDRVTWIVASWEVYLVTGDQQWLRKSYEIARNSIRDDERIVIDPKTGLAHGESSFMDWREQTYPRWMQPVDIYRSESLGTNAVYYRSYQILALMARELKEPAIDWTRKAERIRTGINGLFWNEKAGFYGEYLYGREWLTLSPRADALGEALCILFDVATPPRQREVIHSVPKTAYGIPTVFPESAGVPPYHNRSVWPFVQSFWNLAAAKSGDDELLMYGLSALYREAALFLTNKENFVLDTGSPVGTEINSDRQLWSVAGQLAMVYRVILGIHYEVDGLHFSPFVPNAMKGHYSLTNLPYRDALLSIEVRGAGNRIKRFLFDGKEALPVISSKLRGKHTVSIELDGEASPSRENIRLEESLTALETPSLFSQAGSVSWNPVEGALTYPVRLNGQEAPAVAKTSLQLPTRLYYSELQVAASNNQRGTSFFSEPAIVDIHAVQVPVDGEDQVNHVARASSAPEGNDRSLLLHVSIQKTGLYRITMSYANGNGPINTDNKCAVRTLFIDGRRVGPIVMPQRGANEKTFGPSSAQDARMSAGEHTVELRMLREDINMNVEVNDAHVAFVLLSPIR